MGGPCWLKKPVPAENRVGRFQGPECTDNFQITKFEFRSHPYHSAEQAFQSLKFKADSAARNTIASSSPSASENNSAFGHRMWKLGQSRESPLIDNFEEVKVALMYVVNVAKYIANEKYQKSLIDETSEFEIVGGRSTWEWEKWNGLIHTLIRHKIKKGHDLRCEVLRDYTDVAMAKSIMDEMRKFWVDEDIGTSE